MTALSTLRIVVASALLAAATSSAFAEPGPAKSSAPPDKAKRQCIYERDINGWKDVDDTSVILQARVNDNYLVKLFAPCPEMRFAEVIGFRNRGSDWVCTGETFDLYVRDPGLRTPRHCPAISMTPISRDEANALSSKKKKR